MTSTIQSINSIIEGLQQEFQEVISISRQQDDSLFLQALAPGKWSVAQHLDHLIKSTAPLNQALRMPKFTLRTMFGKCNRPERIFDEVIQRYQQKLAEGGQATGRYLPTESFNKEKEELIQELEEEGPRLLWREEGPLRTAIGPSGHCPGPDGTAGIK